MTDTRFLHGPQTCRYCFPFSTGSELRLGDWRLTNNPGYFGSPTPRILVLGFSKGASQNRVSETGDFDSVAFAGARHRLEEILRVLEIMPHDRSIDSLMTAAEKEFGIASLVRCSLSKLKNGTWKTSGDVIPSAFAGADTAGLIHNCASRFLSRLPESVRLVVLLGTDNRYIERTRTLFQRLYSDWLSMDDLNFRAGGALWIYATHPSPLNGHFKSWVEWPVTESAGRKRELAKLALRDNGMIGAV